MGSDYYLKKKFKNRCLVPQVQAGSATNSLCDLGCIILSVTPYRHCNCL